jgi:hypothetical protein
MYQSYSVKGEAGMEFPGEQVLPEAAESQRKQE